MSISVETDTTVNATYVRLSTELVHHTVKVDDQVIVDLDVHNMVVGIELLGRDAKLPFDELNTRFHVHSSVVDVLRMMVPPYFTSGNDGSTVSTGSPAFV